jgi:hypothetical protein
MTIWDFLALCLVISLGLIVWFVVVLWQEGPWTGF